MAAGLTAWVMQGADAANEQANATLDNVRKAMGFSMPRRR